jgi:ABC-type transport system involved in multi-copper enzyme maturation permease subunit
MFVGPVFSREVTIAPRRPRIYIARTVYASALLVLMFTAWLVLTGTQLIRDLGDLARFGMILFQLLAPLQLALAVFFSAMLAASAVAQEKDRRTLILLLLTHLSNSELVLGKLLSSLLSVLVMLAAGLPLFMLAALLGGVSFGQIARVLAVTLATVLACGSLGSTLALWREKTFQALAMTVLSLVLWLTVWEIVASGTLGRSFCGLSCEAWAVAFSPWQAILEAARPQMQALPALGTLGTPVYLYLMVAVVISLVLDGLAVAMVRVWNPSREMQPAAEETAAPRPESIFGTEEDQALAGSAQGPGAADRASEIGSQEADVATHRVQPVAANSHSARTRHAWDNPILWREMRTWAYGRKLLVLRLAYLVLFALAAGSLYWMVAHEQLAAYSGGAVALVPLFLLSLVLVNTQAVTSLTSERDVKALDLLLVTDLTPWEIVFGKLGGVFYNTKEMVLLPMLLCGYLCFADALSLENLIYLLGGLAVMYVFAAVLGIHLGMVYFNTRNAIATSLGTVFFLFLGVATCMRMMIAFSGSFQAQLLPFFAMFLVGGMGLYVTLGVRNPSPAIGVASFLCPFATFYAITSFLLGWTLGVFLVTVAAYGFTTAAMLIPAIYEFDVATGRTTVEEG